MMNENFDFHAHFRPLWTDSLDPNEQFPQFSPLVAHYCSVSTLEAIVKNNELWFSNPIYANDYEELTFGVTHSRRLIRETDSIRTIFRNETVYNKFLEILDTLFLHFEQGVEQDIYIACFSIHEPHRDDGLLSMWRGYGANGSGAAIVFDTSVLKELPNSPLVVGKVCYGTSNQRLGWITEILNRFADLMSKADFNSDDPLAEIWLAKCAMQLFERLVMLSVFIKHIGFEEEKEFRVVYFRHRDGKNLLSHMLGYAIIDGVVHPKFKFKIAPVDGAAGTTVSLDHMIKKIILGPSGASTRSAWAVKRMLSTLGRSNLAQLVVTSSTPYRAK
jgi:hypothetical protein